MLRNAVDHGLEPAEVRLAAGKPAQGRITLDLSREGGDIVFDIRDDGAGVPLEAVRRKAIKRGLLAPDADISDREVLQFILQPGFSTAEKITQISGRGVGMDVVHEEVRQLGGTHEHRLGAGAGRALPHSPAVHRVGQPRADGAVRRGSVRDSAEHHRRHRARVAERTGRALTGSIRRVINTPASTMSCAISASC